MNLNCVPLFLCLVLCVALCAALHPFPNARFRSSRNTDSNWVCQAGAKCGAQPKSSPQVDGDGGPCCCLTNDDATHNTGRCGLFTDCPDNGNLVQQWSHRNCFLRPPQEAQSGSIGTNLNAQFDKKNQIIKAQDNKLLQVINLDQPKQQREFIHDIYKGPTKNEYNEALNQHVNGYQSEKQTKVMTHVGVMVAEVIFFGGSSVSFTCSAANYHEGTGKNDYYSYEEGGLHTEYFCLARLVSTLKDNPYNLNINEKVVFKNEEGAQFSGPKKNELKEKIKFANNFHGGAIGPDVLLPSKTNNYIRGIRVRFILQLSMCENACQPLWERFISYMWSTFGITVELMTSVVHNQK